MPRILDPPPRGLLLPPPVGRVHRLVGELLLDPLLPEEEGVPWADAVALVKAV